ncbi:MAG: TM0996/MTH895 family glutaredoxin-like protein [Anaerolineaceae bacterium]|nr:TM0996/MTH895 family glutaredoxin-like protein [Anaerolineaceae bacterium]
MMEIKILGGGCPKCERLEAITREVVEELGVPATFTKVKTMPEIMAYDIMTTPALVINEKVLCSGRIPSKEEIQGWITDLN